MNETEKYPYTNIKQHKYMKTLKLSSTNCKILGVCGGIAEYFGIDATIVRLLAALITIFSVGIGGIAAYVIAYFVMNDSKIDTKQ